MLIIDIRKEVVGERIDAFIELVLHEIHGGRGNTLPRWNTGDVTCGRTFDGGGRLGDRMARLLDLQAAVVDAGGPVYELKFHHG